MSLTARNLVLPWPPHTAVPIQNKIDLFFIFRVPIIKRRLIKVFNKFLKNGIPEEPPLRFSGIALNGKIGIRPVSILLRVFRTIVNQVALRLPCLFKHYHFPDAPKYHLPVPYNQQTIKINTRGPPRGINSQAVLARR